MEDKEFDDIMLRSTRMREELGRRVLEINQFGDRVVDDAVDLRGQIQRLADFILDNVPGEPSKSVGAVDCAIGIINRLKREVEQLKQDKLDMADKISVLVVDKGNLQRHVEKEISALVAENDRWQKLYTELEASYDRMRKHLWEEEPQEGPIKCG